MTRSGNRHARGQARANSRKTPGKSSSSREISKENANREDSTSSDNEHVLKTGTASFMTQSTIQPSGSPHVSTDARSTMLENAMVSLDRSFQTEFPLLAESFGVSPSISASPANLPGRTAKGDPVKDTIVGSRNVIIDHEKHSWRIPNLQYLGPVDSSLPVHEAWKVGPGYAPPLTSKAALLEVFPACVPSYEHLIQHVDGWANTVPIYSDFRQLDRFSPKIHILDQLRKIQNFLVLYRIPYHKWSQLSLELLSEEFRARAFETIATTCHTTIHGINWCTLCRHLVTPQELNKLYCLGITAFFSLLPDPSETAPAFLARVEIVLDRHCISPHTEFCRRQIKLWMEAFYPTNMPPPFEHGYIKFKQFFQQQYSCLRPRPLLADHSDYLPTIIRPTDHPLLPFFLPQAVGARRTYTPKNQDTKRQHFQTIRFNKKTYDANRYTLERLRSARQSGEKLLARFTVDFVVEFTPAPKNQTYRRARSYLTLDSDAFPDLFQRPFSSISLACDPIDDPLDPAAFACWVDFTPVSSTDHLTPFLPNMAFVDDMRFSDSDEDFE